MGSAEGGDGGLAGGALAPQTLQGWCARPRQGSQKTGHLRHRPRVQRGRVRVLGGITPLRVSTRGNGLEPQACELFCQVLPPRRHS